MPSGGISVRWTLTQAAKVKAMRMQKVIRNSIIAAAKDGDDVDATSNQSGDDDENYAAMGNNLENKS